MIPDEESELTVTRAIFNGDCNILYVQDNDDKPDIAVHASVEAMVWDCYRSPSQIKGKSIINWPSDGIGLFVTIEKDKRDLVEM